MCDVEKKPPSQSHTHSGNIRNTFFGPHELSVAFRKVLDSLLDPRVRFVFVVFFVEPNFFVVVYGPGVTAIPADFRVNTGFRITQTCSISGVFTAGVLLRENYGNAE